MSCRSLLTLVAGEGAPPSLTILPPVFPSDGSGEGPPSAVSSNEYERAAEQTRSRHMAGFWDPAGRVGVALMVARLAGLWRGFRSGRRRLPASARRGGRGFAAR